MIGFLRADLGTHFRSTSVSVATLPFFPRSNVSFPSWRKLWSLLRRGATGASYILQAFMRLNWMRSTVMVWSSSEGSLGAWTLLESSVTHGRTNCFSPLTSDRLMPQTSETFTRPFTRPFTRLFHGLLHAGRVQLYYSRERRALLCFLTRPVEFVALMCDRRNCRSPSWHGPILLCSCVVRACRPARQA